MSDAGSSKNRALRRVALAVPVVAALLAGAAMGARARARRDWPSPAPGPIALAPAPFEQEPARWSAFQSALDAAPSASRASLHQALESDELVVIDGAIAPFRAALDRFDAALAGGFAAPPTTVGDSRPSPFIPLLRLSQASALRARLDILRGERAAAVERLRPLLWLGARLPQHSRTLVGVAAGYAIEAQALRELARALRDGPIEDPALAAIDRGLDESLAWPSPLPRAWASECIAMEGLFDQLRARPSSDLLSMSTLDEPRRSERGFTLLPTRWVFDPDETIAAHRAECHTAVRALSAPRGARTLPARRRYIAEGGVTVGQYLDNRLGRVLLDVAAMAPTDLVKRDDDRFVSASTARVAMALARHRAARGALPRSLSELDERAQRAARDAALGARSIQWDPDGRVLRATGLGRTSADRWEFSQ